MNNSVEKKDSQNFFVLASIPSAAVSLPCFMIGDILAKKYGDGIAIGSIIAGNLILWLIGMAIISMGSQNRINGIQNIKNYLGKLGCLLSAFILIICFLDWFALQINITVENLQTILPSGYFTRKDFPIRLGTSLGLFSALLALGGIRLLKWISVIVFPLLLIYQVFAIWQSGYSLTSYSIGLSLSATMTVISLFLPGIVNLPTFFRYSKSPADSVLGLSLFTVACIFFESSTIWIQSTEYYVIGSLGVFAAFFFLISVLTSSNLLNIYFASACYDTLVPRFSGIKGHAIIGLLGSAIYAFVQIEAPLSFLVDLFNCYLLSLGTVLLIAFFIRKFVNHRIRPLEKWISCLVWVVGCIAGTFTKIHHPDNELYFLLIGMGVVFLLFLCILLVEETIWAIRELVLQKGKKEHV